MVDAKLWLKAENETVFHRSQIQGFIYNRHGEGGRVGLHCVRGCMRRENQEIWSHEGTEEDYDRLHADAAVAIGVEQIEIVARRYRELARKERNVV
jgi:hypothetical protein